MKTRTWILLFALLLGLCLGLGAAFWLPKDGSGANFAEISSQGTVIATVDLSVDQTIPVTHGEDYNLLTVQDGKIAVTEASCPDHYCMHRGYCNSGTEIVCLPNRLVIRFLGEQTVDAAVG